MYSLSFTFFCLFLVIWCVFSSHQEDDPTIYAPVIHLPNQGSVIGLVQNVSNTKVFLYQGIRYGLYMDEFYSLLKFSHVLGRVITRFSRPLPERNWASLMNATTWKDSCSQRMLPNVKLFDVLRQTQIQNEDCLYLSIWSPVQTNSESRPVMVWLHGGGFESDTIFSLLYDGRYLSGIGNVLVVSVNYRLDAFGFLYGGTNDAPGNAGIHDIMLALKWVQQNISHFGGNPRQVTIFGHSAGSMLIGALLLSPLAKGLFSRAIMQSGAPNSYFGSESAAQSLEKTILLMKKLNCTLNSISQNINCLRTKTVDQILNATYQGFYSRHFGFVPIYGDEVMPLKPVLALRSGTVNQDVDLMFGVTRDEGTTFVGSMFKEFLNNSITNYTLESTKWRIVRIMRHYKESFSHEVAQYYTSTLNQNSSNDEMKVSISNAFADYFFVCPTVLFAEHYARVSPRSNFYAYRLMQTSNVSFGDCTIEWMGVCHSQDIFYLFVVPNEQFVTRMIFGENDKELSKHMISAWTRFAQTGYIDQSFGGQRWEQAFASNRSNGYLTHHFNLDVTNYQMVSHYFHDVCNRFWKPKIFH